MKITRSLAIICCLIAACSCAYSQTAKTKVNALDNSEKKPTVCKLSSPELQKRKATVIASIKKLIKEKKELSNGYSYRFEGSDNNINLLTDFIKTERQCCNFFNFSIDVNNDQSAWLKITGNKGVKDFIASELQL